MKKIAFLAVIVIIILLATASAVFLIFSNPFGDKEERSKFTGIISEINNGCTYDGICFIVVGDKEVIFGSGTVPSDGSEPIWGSVSRDLQIGKKVEVYASCRDNKCSLSGNKGFYIKILD